MFSSFYVMWDSVAYLFYFVINQEPSPSCRQHGVWRIDLVLFGWLDTLIYELQFYFLVTAGRWECEMKSCAQLNRFTIERTSPPAGKEPRLTRWNVVGICTEMTGVTEAFLYIFFFKIICPCPMAI